MGITLDRVKHLIRFGILLTVPFVGMCIEAHAQTPTQIYLAGPNPEVGTSSSFTVVALVYPLPTTETSVSIVPQTPNTVCTAGNSNGTYFYFDCTGGVVSGSGGYATVTCTALPYNVSCGTYTYYWSFTNPEPFISETLSSSPNPSVYGEDVSVFANFHPVSGVPGRIGGTISFYDYDTGALLATVPDIGTGGLDGVVGAFDTTTLPIGSDDLVAVYSGINGYPPDATNPITQVVNAPSFPATLISSLNPSVYTQSVTFTVTIPALNPQPTGTFTFLDGSTTLASGVTLTNNATTAVYSTNTLSVGVHPITAVYSGDPLYAATTSNLVDQVVTKSPVTVTVAGVPNPSLYTQTVTISVSLSGPSGGATPTGTVDLTYGTTDLGSVTLSGGTGTITTAILPVGSDIVIGAYGGDGNYY